MAYLAHASLFCRSAGTRGGGRRPQHAENRGGNDVWGEPSDDQAVAGAAPHHGHPPPQTSPGRPPQIRPDQHVALWAQLEQQPDATLAMHCQRWEEAQGMMVSTHAMARAINRLGWT